MKKEITVSTSTTIKLALGYLTVPILIFFIGWLRLIFAVPAVVLLLAAVIAAVRRIPQELKKYDLVFPFYILPLIFLIIVVWCYLCGQGGFFYQTWDNQYRNAIFRDLIRHSWPVYYETNGGALTYYLTQWLVPALFGKLFGWTAGNVALLLWDAVGICLAVLLVMHFVHASHHPIAVLLIVIGWGGMHWLGNTFTLAAWGNITPVGMCDAFTASWGKPGEGIQISSNHTQIQWVYNQAIAAWIATALLMVTQDISVFVLIGMLMFPYSPLPFLGLFVLMVAYGIRELVQAARQKKVAGFFKKVFSLPNILSAVAVLPVFGSYFACNTAASGEEAGGGFGIYAPEIWAGAPRGRLFLYLLYDVLAFGIYAFLIRKDYKKDLFYHVSLISLLLIPLFKLGTSNDLGMRATIPAYMILMIYTIQYLFHHKAKGRNSLLLIVCLTICSLNVWNEVMADCNYIRESGRFPDPADAIYSLEDYQTGKMNDKLSYVPDISFNFITPEPDETFFFHDLAKQKK